MWLYIIGGILIVTLLFFAVQGIRCHITVIGSCKRLAEYGAETITLSYGKMTYLDREKAAAKAADAASSTGEVILSIHGLFGGYDQAYETCKVFRSGYRIIAPSRFGYLGSDVKGSGTPSEQAATFAELLNLLGIENVYLLATSAGGISAIRFALDYPERTKGLILFCSAMPYLEKPEKYDEYAGVPPFMCNDYAMFLFSPLFETIWGMPSSTIYTMLPIKDRKIGVILDGSVTNPDVARNFDNYKIEDLQTPTLILIAKDDKMASYEQTRKAVSRFPNCTFISFETGGHLMSGNSEKIEKAVSDFILTGGLQ